MSLNIPENVAGKSRRRCLTETEISGLKEAELNVLVLHDTDDESGCVESIGQEEEGKEVHESMSVVMSVI